MNQSIRTALIIIILLPLFSQTGISQELILPEDYPSYSISDVNDPDPGYLFMFPRPQTPNKYPGYLCIIDNFGIPVYYRHLPYASGRFKIQPNGLISFLRRDSDTTLIYLVDHSFNMVDSIGMEGYKFDTHDFIAMENGHFLLFGLDLRSIDMSQVVEGGQVDATVKGCVIQELDENKNIVFEWNSFDHYQITDSNKDLTVSSIDYVHPNSLELDKEGNIFLIARAMNEVTKINRQTGEIMWRLGGKNNQFEFADSSQMFSMPHSITLLSNGNFTIFDNGNDRDPAYSRGLEYHIDEENKSIDLVWEYDAEKAVFGPSGGSIQRLPSGNTIHCYGGQVSQPSVIEVHKDGSPAFVLGFEDPNIRMASVNRHPWKTTLFSANTDTVNFGEWDGYTHGVYILKVTNHAPTPLELSNYHMHSDAFSLDSEQFPMTLEPGEQKSIHVFYYPDGVESDEIKDVLTINSDIHTGTLIQRFAIQVHLEGTKVYSSRDHQSVPGRNLKIFPNPAGDYLKIETGGGSMGQLRIFSISGGEIFQDYIENGTVNIDLSNFPKGFYMLEIKDHHTRSSQWGSFIKL